MIKKYNKSIFFSLLLDSFFLTSFFPFGNIDLYHTEKAVCFTFDDNKIVLIFDKIILLHFYFLSIINQGEKV